MKGACEDGAMPSAAIPFTKMHGLRNDYVVVDATREAPADPAALARATAERRAGVGSDGLLLALPSAQADIRMRMFNPDGSEAEMCGNGLRCLALFAVQRGLVEAGRPLRVETGAGVLGARVELGADGRDGRVTVDMGPPELGGPLALELDGAVHDFVRVSMGNPHTVCFVEAVDSAPVETLGPRVETHATFPDRTNVEFVEVLDRTHVRQRTWERGAGETLACGTGACAVVVAAVESGHTDRTVHVALRGGTLEVTWREDGHVEMTGPAVFVFDGQWALADSPLAASDAGPQA